MILLTQNSRKHKLASGDREQISGLLGWWALF